MQLMEVLLERLHDALGHGQRDHEFNLAFPFHDGDDLLSHFNFLIFVPVPAAQVLLLLHMLHDLGFPSLLGSFCVIIVALEEIARELDVRVWL